MRRKFPAGVLMTLALLIPAAPASAHAEAPGRDAACQTIERKIFTDIRKLVIVDPDTATDAEIEVIATQILTAAKTDSLPVLPSAMQERLKGTAEDLRAFLKKGMHTAWTADLRISVGRTMTGAGTNVHAAAQKVLDDGAVDAILVYLNEGLYAARELDCASKPSATPSVKPSVTPSARPTVTTTATATASASASVTAPATTSVSASVTASASTSAVPDGDGGDGGGLALTGSATGIVAGIGGALLLLGGAGYVLGRRRRSRFVA